LFIRYNTGVWLAGGDVPALDRLNRKGDAVAPLNSRQAQPVDFDPSATGSAKDVVDAWVNRLIQRPISDDEKQILVNALGGDSTNADAVRKVVQLIVSMPEYQLC
jgi:hypothetical protein